MINNFIKKLFNKEVILYIIFGFLTTFVDTIIFFMFNNILKLNYIFSTCMAWFFAVLFSYITNKLFVFSYKRNTNKLLKEIMSFFSLRLISLVLSIVFMIIMIEILNISEFLSKILVNFVVVVINYFFSKLFIFT